MLRGLEGLEVDARPRRRRRWALAVKAESSGEAVAGGFNSTPAAGSIESPPASSTTPSAWCDQRRPRRRLSAPFGLGGGT
jgi:hypothetical protein